MAINPAYLSLRRSPGPPGHAEPFPVLLSVTPMVTLYFPTALEDSWSVSSKISKTFISSLGVPLTFQLYQEMGTPWEKLLTLQPSQVGPFLSPIF